MSHSDTVRIDSETLEQLRAWCKTSLPVETGGILLGYRTTTEMIVLRAIEVPDSNAHWLGYTRRRTPAQRLLDSYREAQPPSSDIGWVGDFHSHPTDQPASRRDLRVLRRNARADGHPLALLVVAYRGGDWTFYGYTSDGQTCQPAMIATM